MAFNGVNGHESPSQQHAGLQHAVFQLQQEVIRLLARFKHTLSEKYGLDESVIRCQFI